MFLVLDPPLVCHLALDPLLICCLSLLVLKSLISLLSHLVLALVPGYAVVLLPFFLLDPALSHLGSTALKTFKPALSDEPFHRYLTSLAGFFCPFLLFGSLPNKIDCKQTFDIIFINSCLFANNHARKEVDLSFAECGCLIAVKLNQL